MSKAILVIDMPTDCEDCPLFQDGDKGFRMCKAKSKGVEWDYYNSKPDWCPLKEVLIGTYDEAIDIVKRGGVE